jgi:hypothetical protein
MENWLAASLSLADGRVIRFGGDEADVQNVPYGISFDTQIPGGFSSGSITLPRPESLLADDARLFSDVKIYGPIGTVYEGYVVGVPQVGPEEIQLQLSGWSTSLDRIQTFREIFVDRDLGRWGEMSRQRRLDVLASASYSIESASVEPDPTNGLPALNLPAQNDVVNPLSEAWYDAGAGNLIAAIYYDMTSLSTSSYDGIVGVASNDLAADQFFTSDLLTGTDSAASGTFTPTAPRRWARVRLLLSGTVSSGDKGMTFRNLAVYGNHGLTLQGSDPKGVLGSDVVRYVINQSPLNTTTDSVEVSTFVIPHLIFPEDTSLTDVIEQVTSLGGASNLPPDWGVYEDRTFFWRTPGTYGRTWSVRKDQVATPTSQGPDADTRAAGVKVTYTDAAGTSKSVGPPGSNADFETSDLLDVDPDNPAKRIPGAFATESVGITSQAGAVNIGKIILAERNRLRWRGGVEIQGEATDQNGNPYPVSQVRAGDNIVIEDDPDTRPRPINSTSYSHESLSLSASIGARPDSLEALLGRLAAVTGALG